MMRDPLSPARGIYNGLVIMAIFYALAITALGGLMIGGFTIGTQQVVAVVKRVNAANQEQFIADPRSVVSELRGR